MICCFGIGSGFKSSLSRTWSLSNNVEQAVPSLVSFILVHSAVLLPRAAARVSAGAREPLAISVECRMQITD